MESGDAGLVNPSAPAGKSLKYARPERERRFLLNGVPAGDVVKTAEITDRYLVDTRLRLRRSVEHSADGNFTIYKLTQKIPMPGSTMGLITAVYLEHREYITLCTPSAVVLEKTRLSIPPFGVDVFRGSLSGLVLAEIEFDDDDAMREFEPEIPFLAEVTNDHRFAGGTLVTARRDQLLDAINDAANPTEPAREPG